MTQTIKVATMLNPIERFKALFAGQSGINETSMQVPFTVHDQMTAFQVQMASFGEMKGPCIIHIIFRSVTLYLDIFWYLGLKILSRDFKF